MTSLTKLQVLDLSSNQFTAVTAAELRSLPSLKEVILRDNPMEPSCRAVLASIVDIGITL